MTARRRRPVARCSECRKPVDISDRSLVRREVPAGLNMSRLHRMVTAYWHPACFAEVGRWIAESRERAAEQQRADVEALRAQLAADIAAGRAS